MPYMAKMSELKGAFEREADKFAAAYYGYREEARGLLNGLFNAGTILIPWRSGASSAWRWSRRRSGGQRHQDRPVG